MGAGSGLGSEFVSGHNEGGIIWIVGIMSIYDNPMGTPYKHEAESRSCYPDMSDPAY